MEYTGKDMVISWAYGTAPGTITLQADYRTFSWAPTQEKFNVRTGAEQAETYITGATDFTASYDGLHQAGTAGTEIYALALAMGTKGTLTVQPQGTAGSLPKIVLPCFVDGPSLPSFAYNDLVHVTATWQGNGTFTVGNN